MNGNHEERSRKGQRCKSPPNLTKAQMRELKAMLEAFDHIHRHTRGRGPIWSYLMWSTRLLAAYATKRPPSVRVNDLQAARFFRIAESVWGKAFTNEVRRWYWREESTQQAKA